MVCYCIPYNILIIFSTEQHLLIRNSILAMNLKSMRRPKIVTYISTQSATVQLQKEQSLCLPIDLVIFLDFSYAEHSGRIRETDQIRNIIYASASSVF